MPKPTPEQEKQMRELRQKMQQMSAGRGAATGGGGPGGPGGPPQMMSPMGAPGQNPMQAMMAMMSAGASSAQFSAKDLENAKLPPPPGEDTQFDVLLRPGLLADVEIIVDKISDALSLPMQAIFEKDGKPVVYVKKGSEYEARVIKPLKRSESTMVISSGVTDGEVVALADPTAKPDKNKKGKQAQGGGSGGAMGALPGGGGKQ